MFSDLVARIKESQVSSVLQVGSYVDVFDNFNSWRNAIVVKLNENEMTVSFDGWPSKYDETHRLNSVKVAYFRHHSDPYTGASKNAAREFVFQKEVDHINQVIQRLQKLIIEDFNMPAGEMCQFLRGELYFMIDSILQDGVYSHGDLRTSCDLMEAFMRFFIVWVQKVIQFLGIYIQAHSVNHLLFYFHQQTAIVACFPEMFDTLAKILNGVQPRTKRYFQANELGLCKIYQTSNPYAGFFNYFQDIKGIDAVISLLKVEVIEENEVKYRIPFYVIQKMLGLIEAIGRCSPKNQDWMNVVKDLIFNRIQSLTTWDHKDNTNYLFMVLKQLPSSFANNQKLIQDCELAEVKLAVGLIKSPVLDRKFKGIKELTEIIEKSQRHYQAMSTTFLNEQNLSRFLSEERLFDILMSEAQHSEVFKKTAPIFKFIAEQTSLPQQDLQSLWDASQQRHEAESKSVYEIISEISRVLSVEQIDFIHQSILQIPQADYDQNLIGFIRDFSLNVQRNNTKTRSKLTTVALLWDLIQDKSQLPSALVNNALQSFVVAFKSEKEMYMSLCLENIRKQISFPQSIYILQKIIESYGPGQMWNSNSSEDTLHKIMKECQLANLITQNIENYRGSVSPTTDNQLVLQGKLPHYQRIQYCLEFLEYIAASPKKYDFSIENFKRLWQALVVSPAHESDRQPLLDLLLKVRFREDLFKSIFCQLNYPIKQCYKSIEKYFYQINIKNNSLQMQKSQVRVVRYDQVIGLDFFFDVSFQSNDCPQALQTLVNLHLRTEKVSQVDQKVQMWNTFLMRCKEALKSQCNISNVIKCLKLLVIGIEGKVYLNGNTPEQAMTKFTVRIGKDDKTSKEVQLPSNCTFLTLRNHLNVLYSLKNQDFDFYLQNFENTRLNQESEEEYSIQVIEDSHTKNRDMTDIVIQMSNSINPHYQSIKKFKAMLASNSEIAEQLFDLLQSDNYEDIWEVLTLMPQNKQISQSIENGATDEDRWSRILFFNCNKKLLYCLQILESQLVSQKDITNFVKARGALALSKYFIRRQESEFGNLFNLKCFGQIAKILSMCAIFDPELANRSLKYIIFALNKLDGKSSDSTSYQAFLQNTFKLVIQEPSQDYLEIINFLLTAQEVSIRSIICQNLIGLSKLSGYFYSYLQEQDLSKVCELKNQAEQYLEFFTGILEQQSQLELVKLAESLASILSKLVEQTDVDKILAASFKLLYVIVLKCPSSKILIQTNQDLQDAIIQKCLFQLPGITEAGAKCQSVDSRNAGYQLVQLLFANKSLMEIFDKYIEYAYWRTSSLQNWGVAQTSQQKSRTGYVGLKNLGCTCYMNSLMQQLFTLPNFRDCVLQLNIEQKANSVLYQFQLLLSALKNSQKQYYDPRTFTNVLGPDGGPINTIEQMDVDEFWIGLMDKLESELKKMDRDMIIKKSFGGYLSNELICKGCPHESSKEELFLALSLQVKGKKNIYESLQTMTEGEMLEGDNAYFCEKCEKKIPTLMRVCVKRLPNVLVCVLKRFEFNYENMQKFKLNDYYEFPNNLNMKPYTYGTLRKQQQETDDDEEQPLDIEDFPEEYYEYQLRGVIVHSGTAESGHYISLIKDAQTQLWNEFNDTLVRPFDFNELANEAFGNSTQGIMGRHKNAYMLFYERKMYFDEAGKALKNEQDLRWFFNNNSVQKDKQNDEIIKDNVKFQISQILFEESFFEFSYHLIRNADEYPISRYCLQYFLAVTVRTMEKSNLPKYLLELRRIMKSNYKLANEFVESIQERDLLFELIIMSPIHDMRVIITGLLGEALKCISETERNYKYSDFLNQSVIPQFIKSMLFYVNDLKNQVKQCDQLYRLLYFTTLNDNALKYLVEMKTAGRIMLFFLEEPPIGAGYLELKAPQIVTKLMRIDKGYIQQEAIQPQTYPKWDNQNQDYSYLIMTLSALIQSLDDDEIALLYDSTLIKRLLHIAHTKQARSALKNIYTYAIVLYSFQQDNWMSSISLVQQVQEYIKDSDEREIRSALLLLRGIGEIQDAHEPDRMILVAEAFLVSLKDGLSYWHYASLIFDYIVKICVNIKFMKAFASVLQNNKSVLKLFENWCKESANPMQNFTSMRVTKLISQWKLYKRRTANVIPQDFQDKSAKVQSMANKRLELLNKITKQQIYDNGYDSDSGTPDLRVGAAIDLIYPIRQYLNNFDNSNYQTWEISQNIGDMIEIRNNNLVKWVHITDSSIAPCATLTIKYENYVNFNK